jgi:xyloglucan-specific exo-beta-1,4-glucanase
MAATVERIRVLALAVVALCAACTPHAGEAPVTMPATASALAVAPDFSGTIWAATGGRVYRSRNGGHSWEGVAGAGGATGLAFLSTRIVTVGPRGVQTGGFGAPRLRRPRPAGVSLQAVATPYYRTGRLYGVDGSGRLWVSVRNGARWSRLRAAGLPAGAVAVAAIRGDVHRPDVIYVACGANGLWRSRDFGATFRRVPGVEEATAVADTTDDQRRLMTASPAGIELSTDAGRTFTRVSSVGNVRALAFDLRNWRLAYAATAGGVLLRSDDGGRTWQTG